MTPDLKQTYTHTAQYRLPILLDLFATGHLQNDRHGGKVQTGFGLNRKLTALDSSSMSSKLTSALTAGDGDKSSIALLEGIIK